MQRATWVWVALRDVYLEFLIQQGCITGYGCLGVREDAVSNFEGVRINVSGTSTGMYGIRSLAPEEDTATAVTPITNMIRRQVLPTRNLMEWL